MIGQGLSPAGMGTVPQLSIEQAQTSPRRTREETAQGNHLEDRNRMEAEVVDAEADVVDTLLTMRELASNGTGIDRMLQITTGAQGPSRRESAEDDQGTHRSDSAATVPAAGAAAGLARDAFGAQRQSLNACQAAGLGSRPNSGAASHALASRPNSFTGKKRKPGVKDEELANGASQATQFRGGDGREASGATSAEVAALQLQQHLTAAAAAEALAWRQGAASAGGAAGSFPGHIGRVVSEPLIYGGQRLPDAVLARLGLGPLSASVGEVAAVERLRAMVGLGSVNGNGAVAADAAPSAKRPHVLVRQPSAVAAAAAAAAAAALSLSAEDLQQAVAHHHHHQLGAGGAAAGERSSSGRQNYRVQPPAEGQQPNGAAVMAAAAAAAVAAAKAAERGGEEDAADPGAAGSAGAVAAAEGPAGDHVLTHGSAPAAGAAGAAGGAARPGPRQQQQQQQAPRRCTPPSPLGHHSDTGSDSGSPSARVPYSPSNANATHGSEHHPGRGAGGTDAAAAAAATAAAAASAAATGGGGDEPLAGPLGGPQRTSSVISLLHALALQQQQQQQPHGRGGPQGRVADLAELMAGVDAGMAMAAERQGRGSRDRALLQHTTDPLADPRVALGPEHAAAAAAGGFPLDVRDIAAALYGGGKAAAQQAQPRIGGGGGVLHRQLSYNSREHPHVGGVAPGLDMMQVDSSSSPPPPLRTTSGMAEAHLFNPPAAAAAGARVGAAAAMDRTAMDTDAPLAAAAATAAGGGGLPHNAGGAGAAAAAAGDERIHASLAAIERKLLLQEERLVYELKQVRLMQKLLQVQQMKQMVREAMRGKEREAAAAGPDGLPGAGSPFPTAAAPALPAVAGPSTDGGEAGLARLSSMPSQLLAAAARLAAVGSGVAGLPRQLSDVEVLRTSSDTAALAAAAAAAAAHHHAGSADLPYGGGHQGPYQRPQAGRQPHPQQRRGGFTDPAVNGDGADEAWGAAGADGGGRLLSYIAALSNSKGSATAATALAVGGLAAASRRGAAAGAAAAGELDAGGGGGQGLRHRMHGGGSDGGAAAEAPPGGGPASEDEAALLQRRLLQVLLQQRQQVLQEQVIAPALAGGDDGDDQS